MLMNVAESLALPDIATRRETLDFLRIDLEKLRGVSEIVSLAADPVIMQLMSLSEQDTLDFGRL